MIEIPLIKKKIINKPKTIKFCEDCKKNLPIGARRIEAIFSSLDEEGEKRIIKRVHFCNSCYSYLRIKGWF